jgi:hypothetical protein
MADPIPAPITAPMTPPATTPPATPPTDQTGPLDAGHTTSEYALARGVTILASVIAALGTIASFMGAVSPVFAGLPSVGKWLAIGGTTIAALTQAAYGLQRLLIKLKAISAGLVPPPDTSQAAADAAAASIGSKA